MQETGLVHYPYIAIAVITSTLVGVVCNLQSMVFRKSKKLHSTVTPTRMEASTAFAMGSVPATPKGKLVVWLHETI